MKPWIVVIAILICCLVYVIVKLSMPEEGSGSAATAAQVEAVTKVFSGVLSAIKSEDYEQAWNLMSERLKDRMSIAGTFEGFKERAHVMDELATGTIHAESATYIDSCVRLLLTVPSFDDDVHLYFIQEEGQWKWHESRTASEE
jgi:hypothetical protein